MNIDFEDFIKKFYELDSKIYIELDIKENDSNIYDIHTMLLDLLIYGVEFLNLNIINNLDDSIMILQKYFNNINIKININVYKLLDFINNDIYDNRYIRFDNNKKYIINGKHVTKLTLDKINSIYLYNDLNNFNISFSWI